MPLADVFTLPAQCPMCRQPRGRPYLAGTTLHGAIRVGLKCTACHHLWETEMPPAGATPGVEDRRRAPRTAG